MTEPVDGVAKPFFLDEAREIAELHDEMGSAFRSGMERAIRMGELLKTVKDGLPHGAFLPWIEAHCPFKRIQANKYIRLYQHKDAVNVHSDVHLPIDAAIKLIRSEARKEVTTGGEAETCAAGELESLIEQGKRFGTIYADPPWRYGNQATRAATDNHYNTMSPEEIAGLPVSQLVSDHAHLHLWTTNAFLFECPAIMEAWGFEYKGVFVWVKPQMGIGNYWRVSHEFLLLGVRGGLTFSQHNHMSWIQAERGKHSAKPEQIRGLIEGISPSPRLELFGRRLADGWVVWGNEIERDLFYDNLSGGGDDGKSI